MSNEIKIYLRENMKFLRKRRKRSQEEVARALNITRSAFNSYENGIAEPGINLLIKLADFFQVSLDKFVKHDLATFTESQISHMEKGMDVDLTGTKLRVLATTVNTENVENIEMVPVSARAGYTTGYADPDFIAGLPAYNLPFLSPNKKYRSFPIKGDSMPPLVDGAFVTGEYVQDWRSVRNGMPYVIVTKEEGIVFKIVYNQIEENGALLLCSTNPIYEPFAVRVSDILEIWKFVNFINPKFEASEATGKDDVGPVLRVIQKEIGVIKEKINQLDNKF